jgi:hypothetical protein
MDDTWGAETPSKDATATAMIRSGLSDPMFREFDVLAASSYVTAACGCG